MTLYELRKKIQEQIDAKETNEWLKKKSNVYFAIHGIVHIPNRKKTDYQAVVECE